MSDLQSFSPLDERIHIYGRTVKKEPLPLFWTGSGIELVTDGSELWLEAESDYCLWAEWLRIEMDGVLLQRLIVPKGKTKLCIFQGILPGTRHRIRILKEVQPNRADEKRYLLFHRIWTDGALFPCPEKRYRIEFVGDSLSSGEGLGGSELLTDGGGAAFGLAGHFALYTAEHFGADFRILSQSGWGVRCSCENDPICTMPRYYHQICGVVSGERNARLGAFEEQDFSSWKPDAVVINLGSNDGFAIGRPAWTDPVSKETWQMRLGTDGRLTKECDEAFQEAVKAFLREVRRHNPQAYLLWAYGMVDHTMRPYLESAAEAYRKESGDERVGFLLLPPVREGWVGSNHHPNGLSHKAAAELLIGHLGKVLPAYTAGRSLQEADLFLFLGQSNMAGRGKTCEKWPQGAPALTEGAGYEYRAISMPGRLFPIEEPFGAAENNPAGINDVFSSGRLAKSGSMVTSFCNAYYEETGIPIVGVSASKGGSVISQWQRGSEAGYLTDALNRYRDAVRFLQEQKVHIRHRYILWCQGESDGDRGTDPQEYRNMFEEMLEEFFQEGIELCFLIPIGNCNLLGKEEQYLPLRGMQEEIARNNPKVILASSVLASMRERGLMQDAFHYYQQAYNECGEDAGRRVGSFVKQQQNERQREQTKRAD